jgi:RHS repeat-associated protein
MLNLQEIGKVSSASHPELAPYYYRARYYDPAAGRFLNEDLLRLSDGLSRYDYALNSAINYSDPLGLCPWQVRQRPLKGGLGNAVKDTGDPPPSHLYLYNSETGQSIGLGPAKDPPIYNPGKEVPGKWEKQEDPSKNKNDSLMAAVPDAYCGCVDRKAKNPGAPPNYCGLGKPHLGQTPCTNCWNWVAGVLKECRDEYIKQRESKQNNNHLH